jgi:hypothetical protein
MQGDCSADVRGLKTECLEEDAARKCPGRDRIAANARPPPAGMRTAPGREHRAINVPSRLPPRGRSVAKLARPGRLLRPVRCHSLPQVVERQAVEECVNPHDLSVTHLQKPCVRIRVRLAVAGGACRTSGTSGDLMRALKGLITSLMNASRLEYVPDAAERPTTVQLASSASSSKGPPFPVLQASKLAAIACLFRASTSSSVCAMAIPPDRASAANAASRCFLMLDGPPS